MKKFTKTTLAVAVCLMSAQYAHANYDVLDVASVFISGNSDSSNSSSEGVLITSNSCASGCNSASVSVDRAFLDLRTSGEARLNGASSVSVTTPSLTLNGSSTAINGVTSINAGGGSVELQVTSGQVSSTAAFTQVGATAVTGVTSINTTGAGNTTIGGVNNTTRIQGAVNQVDGQTNSMVASDTNTITATNANTITATGGANTLSAATNNNLSAGSNNNLTAVSNNNLNAGSNNLTAVSNNNLSAASNVLTATSVNSIQGPVNNIGTASVSANTLGNALVGTTVTSRAGNATQALANNSASTTVTTALPVSSGLVGATVAPSSQVLLSNAGGTTVDAHGKILRAGAEGYVAPTTPTAAVTVTNGYGNTHGLVVSESQTTLSGGTQSSSLALTDRAATFSNAQTGAPITVTGVANGRADFDAVNVRQFAGAIAAVTAQANIPALSAGQDRNFGIGLGHFMGKSALAMGLTVRGAGNAVYKATLSSGLSTGTTKAVLGVGASWGF